MKAARSLYFRVVMMRQSFDEDKYLQLFISGSEDAFDAIFKRYYEGLRHFTKTLLPYPTDEAEDIVAEMFCQLWQQRSRLQINTTLGAYLYVAVKHKVYDYYRRQKQQFSLPEETLAEAADTHFSQPDDQLHYKYAAERMQQLVATLPPQMQLVFRLQRDEGFTYEEIASLLDISLNSVKTHMFRAVRQLKASWSILPIC
ncbi:RNA polymerase sigma-70 factor [Chitinophaga horti]|uniref:RNA polymerase sigma-70 factor n=1 Tax=Chitinophaga horti TaxID=2920382 RepID=A0ABY6IY39_9BACT|nr:RNA polymerase sigma-70 factor [Chitinophaga horti]UYQ91004.1 RNA polymerase sigma-70 factor [Chitinophaga horti]